MRAFEARRQWILLIWGAGLAVSIAGCGRTLPPGVKIDEATYTSMRDELNAGASGASAVADLQPTGFTTIKGRFHVVGTVPSPGTLTVTADMGVCAPGGKLPPNQQVTIAANGGLSDVVFYLNQDVPESWEHPDDAAKKNAEVSFDQKECIFLTHVLAFRSTQILKVINSDPVAHNTKIDPARGATKENFVMPVGATATYSPGGQSPSPFAVSCSIHPWMSAWMLTRDNPYFAVTDKDGNFEIKNVPTGVPLQFRAWQEKLKFVSNVTLNGAGVTWKKGKLAKVTLEEGKEWVLDVTIDASEF